MEIQTVFYNKTACMRESGEKNMRDWSALDWLATILVIIGALNWGLVGLGGFLEMNLNLVNIIFGSIPPLEYLVYIIIGLAGLYMIYFATERDRTRTHDRT